MKLFELALALVILVASYATITTASEKEGDECAADLQPCVKLWRERPICAKLGGPLCQSIESNNNASHHISNINGEICKNNNSEVFCPMTRKCQAKNATCDLQSASPLSASSTPWGVNCSADHQFCPISMTCLHKNKTCSFKAIYDWAKAGNSLRGPYGTNCSSSQKFCLASMSCVGVNASCDVAYNASAMKSFCPENSTYCGKRASCINGANATCPSFGALNMTGRPDSGGWKQACEAREHLCTRFAVAMSKCWPKISSCANKKGNDSAAPTQAPTTASSNCPQNQTYCNSTKKCQPVNDTCCPMGQKHCHTANHSCIPDNQPCCASNQTYCQVKNRCQPKNESCCPNGQYFCRSGKCIPNHQPCKYKETKKLPCPENALRCKTLVDKTAKFCDVRYKACKALVNATLASFRTEVDNINKELCESSKEYCPLSNGCQTKGTACTVDSTAGFDAKNGSNTTEETPWGNKCPSNQTFCQQTMTCNAKADVCSAKAIVDWSSGNKTSSPYGKACSNGTFCIATMSCGSSCKYNPVNRANNTMANSTNVFNELCAGNDDKHHCIHSFSCQYKNKSCSPFPTYDYTGKNDNGTGWLSACKISDYRCSRLKYGVDQCYNKVKECGKQETKDKIECNHGMVYCKLRDSCQNSSIVCCPHNKTYCPDRKQCIKDGSRCPLDTCTETPCGQIIQKALQCEHLDKICPVVISAPGTVLAMVFKQENRTSPIKCQQDEKYCAALNKCMPSKDPCGIALSAVDWKDEIPWDMSKCGGGKDFCGPLMSCKSKNTTTCTLQSVLDWHKKGNFSVSPCGLACAQGEKFCLKSYSCIKSSANCTFNPPKAYNGTNNETVLDKMCGPYHRFCVKQFRCVRKTEACVDPPKLNFTGVTSDNGTGFLDMCKAKDIFCPAMVRGMLKCAAEKKYAHCVKKTFERCAPGLTLCTKTGKCIKPSQYCLAPGECPPYQKDCPELGGCINKTIKCEVPLSKIIYKSAWFFQKLEEVKPTLFPSGSTIAIVSVSESSGKVEYHDGSKWVAVSGIADKTALVLGKTNMLRFVPTSPVWHGAVQFNYTVMAGTVGQKVDASSSKRNPDDVIVSVILPSVATPNLTEVGGRIQIYEDEKGKFFKLEDKMKLNFMNFSDANNIQFDLQAKMSRLSVSAYREYLKLVQTARAAVAITFLENSTKTGGFKGARPSREKPEVVYDLSKELAISPGKHYHGTLNATFAAAVLYKSANGKLSFDMPQMTRRILFTYMYLNNATDNQHKALQGVIQTFKSSKDRPSKANFLAAITKAESAASGLNKTDFGEIKKWVTLSYDRVKLVTGKDEELPPYKVLNVNTKGGPRQLVYSKDVLKVVVDVKKVNDQPVLTSYLAYFPPIAFNLTQNPNKGFPVKDITERIPYPYGKTPPKFSKILPLISDVDTGDKFGIGIAYARNSSIGAYYYRNSSQGSWELINLKNVLTDGKLVNKSDVLLLKPTAELKFEMHDTNKLWSNLEARKQANLLLVAWDQSDQLSNGIHQFHFPVSKNSSISSKFASAFTARKGCDGKPGSRGKIDACGKCGGDGVWCRGCDNVPHSGAVIDHCGNCTGGTTNKTFNFRKDCGGGCGTSYTDSCGTCQKKGEVTDFMDCAGVCFGKAKKNKCGNCVGGNTTKSLNYGEDLCGVCGGKNDTCLDCANTPRGTKKIDICNKCLEPTSSAFNAQCVKLGTMAVISGKKAGGDKIEVFGAGLKSRGYKTAKCEFYNSTKTFTVPNAAVSGNKFTITTPAAPGAGMFSLRCTLDSDATKYSTISNFTFYDKSSIKITSKDIELEANTAANVTISGTGFVDTGFIKCITDKKQSFVATFVSSTTVKCHIPKQKKSAALKIAPKFGELDNVIPADAANFTVYVTAPAPTSAKFTNNLQALVIAMDKPTQYKGTSCNDLFDAGSIAKFGKRAKCKFRTPKALYVLLRGSPTVKPNDVVSFQKNAVTTKFEDVTKKASGVVNITIQGPDKKIIPKARLSGPAKCGVCSVVKLSAAGSSGDGGRRLKYTWYVKWASDVNVGSLTQAQKDDLTAIQNILKALKDFSPRIKFTKTNIKLDLKYEFMVGVENFLGEVSENASLIVVRENKQLPVVDAGPAQRKIKTSRTFTIQAKPVLSPCLDPNAVAATVLFSWEINAVGIDLGVTDKPRLQIKPGTLQGGKKYTLTVTATMASDQTLSSTKDIILDVESSPLEAAIKGGSYQVVGSTSTLKLDAGPSVDPDSSSDTPWYKWECTKGGKPCFVPDPKNAGRKKRLVMATTQVVTLDVAANLESNTKYVFQMTFNKGNRNATVQKTIEVLPGSPPEAEIRPQKNFKENPTVITIVKARAASTLATTNVTWECVQEDGYAFIDLEAADVVLTKTKFSFFKAPAKKKATSNFALVIAANKLADGVKYKLRASVAHADSTSIAEAVITTNAAPSVGVLQSNPTNGTAMDTVFSISAPEGWADDPDDYPLQYQFGYIKNGKSITIGMFGESNVVEAKLPPGDSNKNNNLTLFVYCKDALGAISSTEITITVMPKVFDAAALSSAQDDILKSFESADWNTAMGNMGALLESIPKGSGDAGVTAMKEKFADSTLNILQTGGVTSDPSAKFAMYGSMASITEGGTAMSADAKTKIKDTIVGIETGSSSKRRKRRAASTPAVTAITAAQGETTLSLLSGIIDGTAYDSNTMKLKTDFLPVVDSTGQKICAGLAVGMPAAIVKDKLVVLRSEKNAFTNVDTTFTDMACNDCPSSLAKTAKVKLGETLKTSYASWDCKGDANDLCSGACLVSSQQIYDLLSPSASPNTTLTSVVHMKLYNPESYTAISVATLAKPVTYHLPVLNVTTNNETYFECKRWTGSAWATTGCQTNHKFILAADNKTQYVECTCTELGYTAAFKANRPPPTTEPPTTAAPTPAPTVIIATTKPPVKARKVKFALQGDYDKLLSTPAKKEQFKKDVTKSLSGSLGVNESQIVNMTFTKGSIIVQFTLLPSASDNDASLGTTLKKLETAVKNNNFTVTLSDGTKLNADPTSFKSWDGDTEPTVESTVVAATTSSGLSETEVIIIACVCGGLALIILVVIVVVCYKKKTNQGQAKVSPLNSEAELRGGDVEMADRNKVDGNYNQAVET